MAYKVKTPLMASEEVIMVHRATLLQGYPKPMGFLVLTNQRVFFEKSGALNAASFGVFSLAMKDFNGIPLSEITNAHTEKSVSGAGMCITTRSNEEFKFALNGFGFSSKKKPRNEFINFINSQKS